MENGYFNDSEREFILTDMRPRRHMNNYLWNEETVCICDHFGFGVSWFKNGNGRRIIESGERNVFIKDKKSGEFYSANRNYNDLPFGVYEAHVGLGYHTVISEYKGVRVEFTVLVPISGTVMLYRVKVKNTGAEKRDLGVYFTLCPHINLTAHSAYGYGEYFKDKSGFVFDHTAFALTEEYKKIYVGCNEICSSYDVDENRFRGVYNGYHDPVGIKRDKLISKGSDFTGKYIAAFQFDVLLSVGEEKEFYFAATAIMNESEIKGIAEKYISRTSFEREMQLQRAENEKYLSVFNVETPDNYLNSQANIWLKRQLSLGKTWGRVYGKGFRDVMQDIAAFVSLDISLARKRILYAFRYQYEDGNPIRMFEPNYHYPYNDGGVWMTGAILSYLNESGDTSILSECVTYLKGDSYENSNFTENTAFEPYGAGNRADNTVLDHLRAAINDLFCCRGAHDLILWRGGDWNDSLNNAGVKNIGESVWLSIATVKAINEFEEILKIAGYDEKEIAHYETKKQKLITAINKFGKTDGRFKYGINDYGEDVGGKERMFLNPQTWAVLAGVDNVSALKEVMRKVEKYLKCKFGYVQCYPSYTEGSDKIGRVSYFRPGLVENGAVYNHGVAFKIVADCILGQGNSAYESLKLISCDNPNNPDSGVEPYAVTNMYIGPENAYNAGYAPMSWITGTAGWLYRCISEYICGIKPTIDGLKIEPCFPDHWNKISATRKFRGETFFIHYEKTGNRSLVCDGEKVDLLIPNGKKEHFVICNF